MLKGNYILDSNSLEVYEIGAALVAILACPPTMGDDEKRGRLQVVLCSEALRNRYEWDEEWASQPQRIKPVYAFHPLRAVKRELNTITRQLQNRLHAAHVAIAFLKEAEMGQLPPDFPADAERFSLNELIRTLKFSEKIDIDNFETRIWRPSLPVIHLESAFAVNMAAAEQDGKRTALGDLIFDQTIITSIIQEAERYETLLSRSKMRIDIEKLVRIRLTGTSQAGSAIS